jgi:hypothetical protein
MKIDQSNSGSPSRGAAILNAANYVLDSGFQKSQIDTARPRGHGGNELRSGRLRAAKHQPLAGAVDPSNGCAGHWSGGASTSRSTTRVVGVSNRSTTAPNVAVLDNPAAVDHEDPPAQSLHVGHVVSRQNDRHIMLLVEACKEPANSLLCNYVETNRRLVQEENSPPSAAHPPIRSRSRKIGSCVTRLRRWSSDLGPAGAPRGARWSLHEGLDGFG